MRPPGPIALVVGIALFAVHAAALPLVIKTCKRDALVVKIDAPSSADRLVIDAELPASIGDDVRVELNGTLRKKGLGKVGAGMHRVEWSMQYRGGFERRVGWTQLVGPFQAAATAPCSTRVIINQSVLDDGSASPGTIAHMVTTQIETELDGFSQFGIGDFTRVQNVRVLWQSAEQLEQSGWMKKMKDPIADGAMVGGWVLVKLTIVFDRVDVPVEVAVVPVISEDELTMAAAIEAKLDVGNRVLQWVADLFRADWFATKIASRELDNAIIETLGAPPPLELPGGRELRFRYCPHEPIVVVPAEYASLPIVVEFSEKDGLRPIALGSVRPREHVKTTAPLSIELELDALNALLFELWQSGFLDEQLDAAGVEERFNSEPIVADMLSLRVEDIALALPPTVWHAGASGGFKLGAEATLTLLDGDTPTPGRVFSTVGFHFVGKDTTEIAAKLRLEDLALTCEPVPGELHPCYGDLVDAMRSRSDELHGELTRLFTEYFNKLVLNQQLGSDIDPTRFTIERAEVYATAKSPTGTVRVDLFGSLGVE
jgi:hypothetical protein